MITRRPSALAITAVPPGRGLPNGFSGRYADFLRAAADDFALDVLPLGRKTLVPLGDAADYPDSARIWSAIEEPPGRFTAAWRRLATPTWARRRPRLDDVLSRSEFQVAIGLHYRSADVLLDLPRHVAKVAVLDEHDATLTHQSLKTDSVELAEVLRERHLFRRVCRETDEVVAISEAEAAKWRRRHVSTTVIPHCVDCDFFTPREVRSVLDVGFFGMLTPGRDAGALWAATALVEAGVTEARRCAFVGAAPSPDVVAWARAGSRVTGRVADMREWYPQVSVVVAADTTGPGAKTTVLEAWAMSRPVVATREALRGLPARDGENALIVAGERQLADAVRSLMANTELAVRIGEGGLRTVRVERSSHTAREAFRTVCHAACVRRDWTSKRDGGRPTP